MDVEDEPTGMYLRRVPNEIAQFTYLKVKLLLH